MRQIRKSEFIAPENPEQHAAMIADSRIMPELRSIWPHAYQETVTVIAAALRAHSARLI